MKFWDSSALVPLVIREEASPDVRTLYASDPAQVVWWSTVVEVRSALARRRASAQIGPGLSSGAWSRLEQLSRDWAEVMPVPAVREAALRLLSQIAFGRRRPATLAAVVASGLDEGSIPFVTLDCRLGQAAAAEGFAVLP